MAYYAFACFTDNIYGGPYVSEDFTLDGAQPTWRRINDGLPSFGSIMCFRVDKFSPWQYQYIYSTSDDGSIYVRDTSVGDGWTKVLDRLQARTICGFSGDDGYDWEYLTWIAPDQSTVGRIWTVYSRHYGGYTYMYVRPMYSDDYGATWNVIDAGSAEREPGSQTIEASGDTIICGIQTALFGGLSFRFSLNGGASWTDSPATSSSVWIQSCWLDPDDPTKAYSTQSSGGGGGYLWRDFMVLDMNSNTIATLQDANNLGSAFEPRITAFYNQMDNLWIDPDDATHQRILQTPQLWVTHDTWSTVDDATPPSFSGVCITASPEDYDRPIISGTNSSINVLASETDTSSTNRAGASSDTNPYTDSIPNIAGSPVKYGLWIVSIPAPSGVFVKDIEIGSTWNEDPVYRGRPLDGESGTWDTVAYPEKHARDIFRDQHLVHLPLGTAEGDIPVWTGDQWESLTGLYLSAVPEHDHDGSEGSGGYLTEDYHDDYSDYGEIATPGAPPVDVARLYARDDSGTTKLFYKRPDNTEVEIGSSAKYGSINFIIDGAGSEITTGIKGVVRVDFACTIVAWEIGSPKESGSIKIDLWKDTQASFPPTNADSITNGHEPELSASWAAEDTDLSDWSDVTVDAGDWIMFNVDSAATTTQVTIDLKVLRT